MITPTMDYLITSSLGNSSQLDENALSDFQILERSGSIIIFLYKSKKYTADILSHDDDFKNIKVCINNYTMTLNLQDDLDQLINKMGMSAMEEEVGGDVHAPMPGLVVKILVKEGDEVKKGDPVLVLEAMKMENLLQAAADGTVQSIHCKATNTVNKGDLLVSIA